MTTQEVLLPLPESLYLRLQRTAQATQQSLTDVLLYAVAVGSPPNWEDAPAEFQADLAALAGIHQRNGAKGLRVEVFVCLGYSDGCEQRLQKNLWIFL